MEADFGPQLRSFMRRHLICREPNGFSLTALGRAWATTMSIAFYDPQILAKLLHRRIKRNLFVPSTYEEEYQLPLFAMFHPEIILRNWPDYKIIGDFITDLRRRNSAWLKEICLLAWRAVWRRAPAARSSWSNLLARCNSSSKSKACANHRQPCSRPLTKEARRDLRRASFVRGCFRLIRVLKEGSKTAAASS